jgi:hypothetical protein
MLRERPRCDQDCRPANGRRPANHGSDNRDQVDARNKPIPPSARGYCYGSNWYGFSPIVHLGHASLGIVPSVYSLINTKHKLCQSLSRPGAPLVGCSVGAEFGSREESRFTSQSCGLCRNPCGNRGTSAKCDYLLEEREIIRKRWDVRIFITAAIVVSITGWSAFAQTQPTRPSAYRTFAMMRSAWATAPLSPCYGNGRRHRWYSFNPTSPCYTGTPYAYYSAFEPFEFFNPTDRKASPGSASLNEDQAKVRIEAKGYLNVSRLEKARRGIWRGKATMKDGTPVDVTFDLEGNIYSELSSRLYIRIYPPHLTR